MARTRRRRISRKAEGIPKEYSKVRIIEIGLKHKCTMQGIFFWIPCPLPLIR
jgi:hypothetical protein